MVAPSSVRFEGRVLDRLNAFAASHPGMSLSGVSKRLVDEALRMQEPAFIVFRDGPAGRRARLIGGPDVWEVIAAILSARNAEPKLDADEIVALVAGTAGLVPQQVRAALAYWADYPAEVDEMFSPLIASSLVGRGIDCQDVATRPALRSLDDHDVLEAARIEGRILVTNNVVDFEILRRRREA